MPGRCRGAAVALLVLLVPVTVGCGSSGEASTATTASTTSPVVTTTTAPAGGGRAPVVGQRATIRYPDHGRPPFPTVVLVHGGAFTEGDRDDPHLEVVGARLRAAGYATASVDYRLGTDIPAELARYRATTGTDYACDPDLPAAGDEAPDDPGGPGRPCLIYLRVIADASEDLAAALADLRHDGPGLDLRTDRLALYGESAGSTLVIGAAVDPGDAGGVAAVVGVSSGALVPAGRTSAKVLLVTYANATLQHVVGPNLVTILRDDVADLRDRGAEADLLELPGNGHLPDDGSPDLDLLIARSIDLYERAGVGPD